MNDEKDENTEKKAPQSTELGYAEALFEGDKLRPNDDFAPDSSTDRYHNQQQVLDVAKGLCHDIFFRADDVNDPDFEKIPDFAEPAESIAFTGKREHKKPLNSRNRNRTYALSPDEKTDEGSVRSSGGPGRSRSRSRSGSNSGSGPGSDSGRRRRRRRPPRGKKR